MGFNSVFKGLRITGIVPPPPVGLHNVMVKEADKTTLLLPLNKM